MPPRGVKKGTKRARQYEHIKESVKEQGKSEDTAEEIAARTVNKERARPARPGRRSHLDPRHLVEPARRPAVGHEPAQRPDTRPAL